MTVRLSLGAGQASPITSHGPPVQPSPMTSTTTSRCAWATPPRSSAWLTTALVLMDFDFPETPVKDRHEIAGSLTAMRQTMLKETSGRVVLGGKVEGYLGSMPGIAEEALLTLRAGTGHSTSSAASADARGTSPRRWKWSNPFTTRLAPHGKSHEVFATYRVRCHEQRFDPR